MSTSENVDSQVTDKAFRISLYLKGLDGLFELLGGLLLLLTKPNQLNHLAEVLTQHELSTNSHDFIANHILRSTRELTSGTMIFGAIYLLSHGIVKVILVFEVLRRRLWAYPALIITVAGFIIYQVYRLTIRLSAGLIFLTVFDLLVIYLTQYEYHKIRYKFNH